MHHDVCIYHFAKCKNYFRMGVNIANCNSCSNRVDLSALPWAIESFSCRIRTINGEIRITCKPFCHVLQPNKTDATEYHKYIRTYIRIVVVRQNFWTNGVAKIGKLLVINQTIRHQYYVAQNRGQRFWANVLLRQIIYCNAMTFHRCWMSFKCIFKTIHCHHQIETMILCFLLRY